MSAREEAIEIMAHAVQDDGRGAFTAEWPWPDPLGVALDALIRAGWLAPDSVVQVGGYDVDGEYHAFHGLDCRNIAVFATQPLNRVPLEEAQGT